MPGSRAPRESGEKAIVLILLSRDRVIHAMGGDVDSPEGEERDGSGLSHSILSAPGIFLTSQATPRVKHAQGVERSWFPPARLLCVDGEARVVSV